MARHAIRVPQHLPGRLVRRAGGRRGAGIAAGVFLGWLALASAAVGASPIDYAIAIAIVAIAAAIGIAAGLLGGSLLRPSIAGSVVVLAAAALVGAAGTSPAASSHRCPAPAMTSARLCGPSAAGWR